MSGSAAPERKWTRVTRHSGDRDNEGGGRPCSTHSVGSTEDGEGMPSCDMRRVDQVAKDSKAKRKVGRPIAYCGDPYAPGLLPEQRRVILRRIANRESARRVRARRQDELERLTEQAQDTKEAAVAQDAEAKAELADLRSQLLAMADENDKLQAETRELKQALAAARHHQQEPESRERELFPVLANLVPYQQDHLGICEALEKPDTPTGRTPALLSAFSQELPHLAPFHVQAQALLPAMSRPVPERTFSDILQDINWAAPRMNDWPADAGCPAGQ